MRLGGEVDDGVGPLARDDGVDALAVADVEPMEGVALTLRDCVERGEVRRVGQLVDVDHGCAARRDEMAANGRADEAGSPRDNDFHASLRVTVRRAGGAGGFILNMTPALFWQDLAVQVQSAASSRRALCPLRHGPG